MTTCTYDTSLCEWLKLLNVRHQPSNNNNKKKHVVTGPIRRLSQCHPTIPIHPGLLPDVSTDTFWNTRIVCHNNNKHTNSARKFPGDFANFQNICRISRRKNNSSRFPGVLDSPNPPMAKKSLAGLLYTMAWAVVHVDYWSRMRTN